MELSSFSCAKGETHFKTDLHKNPPHQHARLREQHPSTFHVLLEHGLAPGKSDTVGFDSARGLAFVSAVV